MAARVESSPVLGYRVLGPLTVEPESGGSLDLGGPRQAAILATLLVHRNHVVQRDQLIHEVWGQQPPPTAAATLQAYVSNLRRLLEPDRPAGVAPRVLVRRGSGYVAQIEPDQLDADRFERLVARAVARAPAEPELVRADLTAALDLWRGPALVEFPDQALAQAAAARWESMRVAATEHLIDLRLAAGEHASVLPEIEHLLRQHPLRERVWGQLMLALYRSGQQAAALQAYRRLRGMLADEMALEPTPELGRLEQAILKHSPELSLDRVTPPSRRPAVASGLRAAAPAPGTPAVARSAAESMPIVGRRSELAQFDAALELAHAGRGSLLLVEGEPGIGKTRLLQAMLELGKREGAVVAEGRCFEGGGAPPYWPWVRVVRELAGTAQGSSLLADGDARLTPLRSWLPQMAQQLEQPPPNPHLVAEAVAFLCRELAQYRPLVVALDDLHGSDPDSLTVLSLLAAELGLTGTVIIGSYRTAEVSDDHGLTDLLARVSRYETVQRVPLRRLPPAAVAELAEWVFGEPVAPAVAASIHSRTSGNALFAVELIRLLGSEPGLVERSPGAIPPGVRDVIRRRVARLPEATCTMLTVAALAGRHFDVDVVAAVVDRSHLSAIDALEVAVVAQLVEEGDRAGLFRFSHALVQETLADSMTSIGRARLHQKLAEQLDVHHGTDPASWSLIAHHAVEAVVVTGPAAALAPLGRAAQQAAAAAATQLALQLRGRYLDLVLTMPASPERDRLELDAHEALSTAVAVQGWVSARLERSAARMVQLARSTGNQHVAIAGLMTRATHYLACGRFRESTTAVEAIDAFAAESGLPMAVLCGHLNGGITAYYLGSTAEALRRFRLGEELLDVVDPGRTGTVLEPPGQLGLLASFWAHRAAVTCLAGEEATAQEQAAAGVAYGARTSAATFSVSLALVLEASLHYMRDDPERALLSGRRAAADTHTAGYAELETFAQVLVAWGEARTGLGGFAAVRDAVLAVPPSAKVEALHQWGMVADAALHAGRPTAVLEAVDQGIAASDETGARMWLPELYRLQAEALRQLGRLDDASTAFAHATELAHEMRALLVSRRLDAALAGP